MKRISLLRNISLVSYVLMVLAGEMIGIPFICWLVFTAFDFGNREQLFAILGILGIILNVTKWKNNISITILSFLMMLSPVISRMVLVPVEKFNYPAFQIPLSVFIIGYWIFIVLNAKKEKPDVSL